MSHWDVFGRERGPLVQPITYLQGHIFGTALFEEFTEPATPLVFDIVEGIDVSFTTTAADTPRVLAQLNGVFFWGGAEDVTTPSVRYFSWRGRCIVPQGLTFRVDATLLANGDISIFVWGRGISGPA